MNFTEMLQGYTGKPLADCTNQELYLALLRSSDTRAPIRCSRSQDASCIYQRRVSDRQAAV